MRRDLGIPDVHFIPRIGFNASGRGHFNFDEFHFPPEVPRALKNSVDATAASKCINPSENQRRRNAFPGREARAGEAGNIRRGVARSIREGREVSGKTRKQQHREGREVSGEEWRDEAPIGSSKVRRL
jgi:hypothetical protein